MERYPLIYYDTLIDFEIKTQQDLYEYCYLAGIRAATEFSKNLDFGFAYLCIPRIAMFNKGK